MLEGKGELHILSFSISHLISSLSFFLASSCTILKIKCVLEGRDEEGGREWFCEWLSYNCTFCAATGFSKLTQTLLEQRPCSTKADLEVTGWEANAATRELGFNGMREVRKSHFEGTSKI